MNKQKIVTFLWVIILILLCSCSFNDSTKVLDSTESYIVNNSSSEEVSDSTINNASFIEQREYVYQKVDEILSLDAYNKGATKERIELIEPVLKELKQDGYIKEYYFELELEKPNIHYVFPDGSKNTIVL